MIKKDSLKFKPYYLIDVKKGKKYAWCSCNLSNIQPFCDGSHSSSKNKPVVFTAEKSETVYLCGCKETKKVPFCDGTHKLL